ncbi:hypothetical protein DFQ26_005006 [Actinomortierella ambigua]|nr:hypothetical protein DFQ26_005006 [Actinomortierella ambigua]
MSTVSLPPTIRGSRNHIDDAERREIFPISDKGAPTLPIGRRGSIGFFRGKRTLASPMAINPAGSAQLFQNLDLTHVHWHPPSRAQQQQQQNTLDSSSPPTTFTSPLAMTPTTTSTTPTTTVVATPTTPAHPTSAPPSLTHCSQPTSPVAASIHDYHPRQKQKLALFMKRNLLPPHALLTTTNTNTTMASSASSSSTLAPPLHSSTLTTSPFSPTTCHCLYSQGPCAATTNGEQYHQWSLTSSASSSPVALAPAPPAVDVIPSGVDIPNLPVADWINRGRWEGEQEWPDDIPEGLEHHDSEAWSQLDSYSIEQHITRTLCKGQNYSAPLDFSARSLPEQSPPAAAESLLDTRNQTQARSIHAQHTLHQTLSLTQEQEHRAFSRSEHAHDEDRLSATGSTTPVPTSTTPSHSLASMSTLASHNLLSSHCKQDERSLVILSVGCGNTQWATEMARAHPQSAVHAINVCQIPSLPTIPEKTPSFDLENLFFYNLDDNSLRIPFASNSVDYIHVRRFLPVISKTKYFSFLRELVRVLKVDGYIELVELDQRLRNSGVASCWPSNWTLIGFDKLGIDASLAMNLSGILKVLAGIEPVHRSSVNIPVGMHGGRIGLTMELLCWKWVMTIRPWLMRQAMLSGVEFDELLDRARAETRTLRSYQTCHIAVGRKVANV